ncbi:uncharacterized protein [Triticum aestivum]|uniref:uncharacterized protein n=1 Tax=Triticum aestivum TaxID=4565 RepID=UPI001D035CB4|nr:uncharacterized protein LOC123080053 [Triticum aestivum]
MTAAGRGVYGANKPTSGDPEKWVCPSCLGGGKPGDMGVVRDVSDWQCVGRATDELVLAGATAAWADCPKGQPLWRQNWATLVDWAARPTEWLNSIAIQHPLHLSHPPQSPLTTLLDSSPSPTSPLPINLGGSAKQNCPFSSRLEGIQRRSRVPVLSPGPAVCPGSEGPVDFGGAAAPTLRWWGGGGGPTYWRFRSPDKVCEADASLCYGQYGLFMMVAWSVTSVLHFRPSESYYLKSEVSFSSSSILSFMEASGIEGENILSIR